MKIKLSFILLLFVLGSCSKRNLTYFDNLEEQTVYTEEITSVAKEPAIQPGDLLSINVTSLNPEANVLFNRGVLSTPGSAAGGVPVVAGSEGYLVDGNGNIEFPVLGSVKVGGLTKSEVKTNLNGLLVQYLKDPIVNIRYLNYRITVVGEVNSPSTLVVPAEKITLMEAIGMAGDLTVFGRRDNVLLIREAEGVRTVVRLNLNDKTVLNSPYFYLQPNDLIYVEPVPARAVQASMTRQNISLALSLVSIAAIIITRFL